MSSSSSGSSSTRRGTVCTRLSGRVGGFGLRRGMSSNRDAKSDDEDDAEDAAVVRRRTESKRCRTRRKNQEEWKRLGSRRPPTHRRHGDLAASDALA